MPPTSMRTAIDGARLHAFRNRSWLSRTVVAYRLGVDQMTVARWERGDFNPSRASVEELARILKFDTDEILVGEPVGVAG